MAKPHYQAPKGTRDLLPPDTARWRALLDAFAAAAARAGFGEVISPVFEDVGVFLRIGDSTDVVTKEMYVFEDKDPQSPQQLALRPELTASVCRVFAQHRPVTPWKVWYEGPQFRYERPQAGRYRQFSQVGAEIIGTDDPAADVEVIALAWRFYEDLGLRRVSLLLNSLGDEVCRPVYFDALVSYLRSRSNDLSEQSRLTLDKNPLRVLDSKRPEDAPVVAEAPVMVDFLTDETAAHFATVRDGLDALGIPFEISPRLVRGLDYYARTTFEFASEALDSAQNAVGGGGRYDRLVEDLGGPPTPGVGFALGVDRILLACDSEDAFPPPEPAVEVFVVDMTDGSQSQLVVDEARRAGIGTDRSFGGRSVKSQMKAADRSGARLAVIIGPDELAAATATVRDLVDGSQEQVARTELVAKLSLKLQTITENAST